MALRRADLKTDGQMQNIGGEGGKKNKIKYKEKGQTLNEDEKK